MPTTACDWSADANNQEVGAESLNLEKADNSASIHAGRFSAQICILIIYYLSLSNLS